MSTEEKLVKEEPPRGKKRKIETTGEGSDLAPPKPKRQKVLSEAKLKYEKEIKKKAKKYSRGSAIKLNKIKDKKLKSELEAVERMAAMATEKAARYELLLPTEPGFLEPEKETEATWKVKQTDIAEAVGPAASTKAFELKLDKYGPYCLDYTRNGRYMLLGGSKGHVAHIDLFRSKHSCELNLGENVYDVQFLHNETMFAVAQKKYVYIYDKKGVELHCLKQHTYPWKLEFLPYHFLLVSIGKEGIIRYQDTSTGTVVCEYKTKLGMCNVMCQNPRNAIIHLGHQNGVVTFWSPNKGTPLVKMLCHRGPVKDVVVDATGQLMATAGVDGRVSIWDLRTYKALQTYYTQRPVEHLDISQTGLLATAWNNHVHVWKDYAQQKQSAPYMIYNLPQGGRIRDVRFCPFEDVLGIGHDTGYNSIIIPGAGEPNFDTYEANPFETKRQRREATVVRLLEKLQPTMINLDTDFIGTVANAPREEHLKLQREVLEEETPSKQWAKEKAERKRQRKDGIRKAANKQTAAEQAKRAAKQEANRKKLLEMRAQHAEESLEEFTTTLDRFRK